MAKTKRWGDSYFDRRDWKKYNEQLIKRGEFFLDLDFIEKWEDELYQMNLGKIGAPYQFPNSLIELQGIWHAKSIPCRMIEGMTRRLADFGKVPNYNDYTTANRRINKLECQLVVPQGNSLTLFSDGTGLQVIESGEYLREKYGKKNRRWVQVIILGDPKSKEPVSFEVNLIQESELDSAKRQLADLRNKKVNIKCFGGDGSYDEIALWNQLVYNGIEPIIKPDKNAIVPSGSRERDKNVEERNLLGYDLWAREHQYGSRWLATEGIFSAVKRMFGEKIHARSERGIIQEAKIKFWAYQKMKRYAEA
ncbi:IS5 family transposase [Candidatus Woesearchaeota archaeon]|nr:IS5 family transposase [Candidatus Woesearchaeota archaeon]